MSGLLHGDWAADQIERKRRTLRELAAELRAAADQVEAAAEDWDPLRGEPEDLLRSYLRAVERVGDVDLEGACSELTGFDFPR